MSLSCRLRNFSHTCIICFLSSTVALSATDLFVNNFSGSDKSGGTEATPFKTAQVAIDTARAGDTIHLLPSGAVYRQMISLRGKTNLNIEGNRVTLTGADPLPATGWEQIDALLFRRRLPTTAYNRHLLIRDGRANRMGRTPSVRIEFPKPEELVAGQFAWVKADEKTGWLYVKGSTSGLEWSVRTAGVATSGINRNITIRNLNTRHALNDGFNIHGDCREFHCFNITGHENFDEGFSAHDTCTVWVTNGKFRGNDNAVADVNFADSYYTNCEFSQSVSTEVLFSGGTHRLDTCRIIASGKVAFSLSSGSHPKFKETSLGQCEITNTLIQSADKEPRPVRIAAENQAAFRIATLTHITVANRGKMTVSGSTIDGQPWLPR